MMRTFFLLALALSALLPASQVHAQADPFGGLDAPAIGGAPNDLFGAPPAPAEPEQASEDTKEQDPPTALSRQWLEHSTRGNVPLAQAAASMARLGRWSDVDQLMTLVDGRGLTEDQFAEMARAIGPALLLRMETSTEISDKARSGATKLREALRSQSESPERLRAAIDSLDSESTDERLSAARTLMAGGQASVVELAAAVVSANPSAPRDEMLRVLLALGSDGKKAFRQLALYGQPDVRLRAVEAMARMDRAVAMLELITALHATDTTPQEVESARQILQSRTAALPSREASINALVGELRRLGEIVNETSNDGRTVMLWSVNPEGNGVTGQRALAMHAAYRDVADMSARLRRIGGLSPAIARSALTADLAYQLVIDPDWGDPDQLQAMRQSLGARQAPTFLLDAIGEMIRLDNRPALLGLIRLIDPTADGLDRSLLFRSGGPSPTPLVAAASHPDARIRFEAASVVAAIAGSEPFADSSQVRRTLSEMRRLKMRPTAILVETRADVIVQQEKQLIALGYDVEVVHSVAMLQRCVAQGGDLRIVLSKTELPDFTAVEMVDMVRRMPRGHDAALVLYGAEVVAAPRWDFPAVLIEPPASPAAYAGILDEIERRRTLPPLSPIERQLFADQAIDLLAKMSPAR